MIGLFCYMIGLFCNVIGLFCLCRWAGARATGMLPSRIGLLHVINRSLLQHDRSLLQCDRSLLQYDRPLLSLQVDRGKGNRNVAE